ncbi:mechanosensitive ion channel family protein [Nitrospira sp. Kam-Ns4a]
MIPDWLDFSERTLIVDGLNSALLLAVILAVRALILRAVHASPGLTVEARRRWVVTIRNITALVFVLGLIFIWGHELSALAVSLVAIAVALVLATKELLLCLSGTVLRLGANAYEIGDRIEIGGIRGNVIDQTALATTVMEIGPGHQSQQYTGRAVIFPNSLLLSQAVINETFTKPYVVQILTVPLTTRDDWQAAEKALLEAARAECTPFMEEARLHMKRLEGRNWLDTPSVDPRVQLHLPEPGRINLLLRFPSPTQGTSRLEQAILRRFLTAYQPAATRSSEPPGGADAPQSGSAPATAR